MPIAKFVRLDTTWSATPQPRRRAAWLRSLRKTAASGLNNPRSAAPEWVRASAAMRTALRGDGHATHAGGQGFSRALTRCGCPARKLPTGLAVEHVVERGDG